ncbi:uncharacterized protein YchJ [Silvibacterium bohemicum]|uniref:Uncharacterized protein YchJ n=1 Tax=Silvibacterium bohemicum TaxID=1577686 RepID=A0A841JT24_9BACT|nr:hypothetical protein [Silvibacterium bohemicum]MBB6143647.1 uncharacterized protein YchJ [Silvibacterium bohemicum]
MPAMLFPILVLLLLGVLVGVALRARKIHARREEASWDQLLSRLTPLGKVGIHEVASAFLTPTSQELDPRQDSGRLESRDIWDFVGGIEGLKRMRQNADVLIELAYYVRRWNPEAAAVAEQLRLDAKEIKTALTKLAREERRGKLATWFPIHATRATAAYYLMTQRVFALYEISNAGLLVQLKSVM